MTATSLDQDSAAIRGTYGRPALQNLAQTEMPPAAQHRHALCTAYIGGLHLGT